MTLIKMIPAYAIMILFILPANLLSSIQTGAQQTPVDTLPRRNTALTSPTDSFYHIYLTFDDGPSIGSKNISERAALDSTPINVFIIGENVFLSDSLQNLFQLYQSNSFVETGNHSFTHAKKHYRVYYQDPQQVVRDMVLNADTLHLQNKIARLPGRNIWRVNGRNRSDLPDGNSAADSLAAKGYLVFGWDMEWKYESDTSRMIQPAIILIERIEYIIQGKKLFKPRHIVILCHDPMFDNENNKLQLQLFIKAIKERKSYRFEHLSNYP